MPTLSTALALSVGGASRVPLIDTLEQAGTATQLPALDSVHLSMQAALITDWEDLDGVLLQTRIYSDF